MYCPANFSPVPAMLLDFKKRLLDSLVHRSSSQEQQPCLSPSGQSQVDALNYPERIDDSVPQQHWDNAMEELVNISGRTCVLCSVPSETVDVAEPMRPAPRPHSESHARRSLPSFRSVMEVLYPPSYLGAHPTPPDPPSYSRSDSSAYLAPENDTEISPLISSTTEGMPLSRSCLDPLAQDPPLTGVPSEGTPPIRALLFEPNPPLIDLDGDVPEESLPAYSRLDQHRSRFPAAADFLGPYPSLAVISRSAR